MQWDISLHDQAFLRALRGEEGIMRAEVRNEARSPGFVADMLAFFTTELTENG